MHAEPAQKTGHDSSTAEDSRRRERRNRTLKSGEIIFNGGFSTIACTIRNLSSGGAMLEVPTVLGIPHDFQLKMSGSPIKNCAIRWRDERHVGVQFV